MLLLEERATLHPPGRPPRGRGRLARRRPRARRRPVRRGVGRGRHDRGRARARPRPQRPGPRSGRGDRPALAKLVAGTYGICEVSGRPIPRGAARGDPAGARARRVQGRRLRSALSARRRPSALRRYRLAGGGRRSAVVVARPAHQVVGARRPSTTGTDRPGLDAAAPPRVQHRRRVQPRRGGLGRLSRLAARRRRGHRRSGRAARIGHASGRSRSAWSSAARSATSSTALVPGGTAGSSGARRRLHRPAVVAGLQRRRLGRGHRRSCCSCLSVAGRRRRGADAGPMADRRDRRACAGAARPGSASTASAAMLTGVSRAAGGRRWSTPAPSRVDGRGRRRRRRSRLVEGDVVESSPCDEAAERRARRPTPTVAVRGRARGRRRDRGRQAGRPGRAPRRRATTAGTLVNGLLARLPRDRRRRRARPARHRPPPRQGHVGPAGRGPHRRGLRRRSWPSSRPARSTAATARSSGATRRRRRAVVDAPDRPLAHATPRAWRSSSAGREARTRYEVVDGVRRAGRGRAARVQARDRPHPPDPRAPRAPSATRSSATTATAARASRCSCPRPFLHADRARRSTTRSPASRCAFDVAAARRPRRGARRAGPPEPADRSAAARGAQSLDRRPRRRRRGPSRRCRPGCSRRGGLAHVLADVGPHGEQHALALVVAGAVLVGLAEVAERRSGRRRR